MRLINHPYNKGYGASLKTGMINSNTELVAFYDSDGQHNPEDLESLASKFGNYNKNTNYQLYTNEIKCVSLVKPRSKKKRKNNNRKSKLK